MGCTQPKRRAVSICSISIQVFPINGTGEKPARSETMVSTLVASVARTSGVRRNFDFWAITNRYLRRERSPFIVTIMVMARGGLSSDVNGISSPQSKTAAVSDGTSAGP